MKNATGQGKIRELSGKKSDQGKVGELLEKVGELSEKYLRRLG